MNIYEGMSLALAAVVAVFGTLKLELIKEMVQQVVSDKGKVSLYSVVLLIVFTLGIALIGFAIPEPKREIQPAPQPVADNRTQEQIWVDEGQEIAKTVVTMSTEIAEQERQRKQAEIDKFEATKEHWWVYQLGEPVHKRSKDALFNVYQQLKNIESVNIFRDGDNYFFFKKTNESKEALEKSLGEFQNTVGNEVIIRIVDLRAKCNYKKQQVIQTGDITLGKKKEKVEFHYYEVSK